MEFKWTLTNKVSTFSYAIFTFKVFCITYSLSGVVLCGTYESYYNSWWGITALDADCDFNTLALVVFKLGIDHKDHE